jgi:hypothetical protein
VSTQAGCCVGSHWDYGVTVSVTFHGANCRCAIDNNCTGFLTIYANGNVIWSGVNDDAEVLASAPCANSVIISARYEGTGGGIDGKICLSPSITLVQEVCP